MIKLASNPNRRRFLATTAGGIAAIGLGLPRMSYAAGDETVVATWGGDYAKFLAEQVDAPFLARAGGTVLHDIGDEDSRVAKLVAQQRLAEGTWDAVSLSSLNAAILGETPILSKIDTSLIPNLANVRPELQSDTFVPHNFGAYTVIYNTQAVASAPKSFADLLSPQYAGKVGLILPGGTNNMLMAALHASGDAALLDKAKEPLLALKANGVRFYPTNETLATAFQSGEIVAAPGFFARMVLWRRAGLPLASAFLDEGAILTVNGMAIPANAPNKERAYAYLNALLDPTNQVGFANALNYWGAVTNLSEGGAVAPELALPEPEPKLVMPDYAKAASFRDEMNEWWRKEYVNA